MTSGHRDPEEVVSLSRPWLLPQVSLWPLFPSTAPPFPFGLLGLGTVTGPTHCLFLLGWPPLCLRRVSVLSPWGIWTVPMPACHEHTAHPREAPQRALGQGGTFPS